MRAKKCPICGESFVPDRQFQKVCGKYACMIGYANEQKKKKARKLKREYRNESKSILIKKAQYEFNKFIRLRDKDEPCISCGYPGNGRQWHASHYISVGKCGALRFDENNVHKSCSICNSWKSGNLTEYRPLLIQKIGIDEVNRLEKHYDLHKNWSIEELKEIIAKYKKRNKAIVEVK